MAKTVVIVGGGWSGCAAAISAKKKGIDQVILLERMEMLLGTGLAGGLMGNNGRYTAAEECKAMGAGELFAITERFTIREGVELPGHEGGGCYDPYRVEPAVVELLRSMGIDIRLETRITDVTHNDGKVVSLTTAKGETLAGDVFVDATGTAGPQGMCNKHGNGCCMCVLRCQSYGGRVSVVGKMGIGEGMAIRPEGFGAMSGSAAVDPRSVDPAVVKQLELYGTLRIPLPEHLKDESTVENKVCQQYAAGTYHDNLWLIFNQNVKFLSPYIPLEKLRQIPGFSGARYIEPLAGGKGNSMRFFAMSPRDDHLKVKGTENLFCAGEKAGVFVGHTEAVATGLLAGHNAAKQAKGEPLLKIPGQTMVGKAIEWVGKQMETPQGLKNRYTFSGSVLLTHLVEQGLYTRNRQEIWTRVKDCGMQNIYCR